MRLKKCLRFLMLLCFILLACIVPFPIKFSKKDELPVYEIEQIDIKEDDTSAEEDYHLFS